MTGREDSKAKSPEKAGVDEAESKRRQRMRSLAIALTLAGLALLFYAATIVRLGGNVANRPL